MIFNSWDFCWSPADSAAPRQVIPEEAAARPRLKSSVLLPIIPARRSGGASENGDLSSLRQELEDALAAEIQRNEVAVPVGPDGLIVSLREIGFFDSGSANIRETSLSAFSRIAWLLLERPYRIRIDGHTDNRPIHNSQFRDNWELSAARATKERSI